MRAYAKSNDRKISQSSVGSTGGMGGHGRMVTLGGFGDQGSLGTLACMSTRVTALSLSELATRLLMVLLAAVTTISLLPKAGYAIEENQGEAWSAEIQATELAVETAELQSGAQANQGAGPASNGTETEQPGLATDIADKPETDQEVTPGDSSALQPDDGAAQQGQPDEAGNELAFGDDNLTLLSTD
ncbi:MAG: hypothetical protein FWD45_05595, partial [Coriobacteriia bacterium]|nr:hypothetical protein [Coriobacteriia bacterium]